MQWPRCDYTGTGRISRMETRMPQLAKVLTQEDMSRGTTTARMDLSAYVDIIESIRSQDGVGGEVELSDGESQRAEKRRLSLAAKQAGMNLTWRKSRDGTLRFVLSEPGGAVPGGRPRRAQEPEPQQPARGTRGSRR